MHLVRSLPGFALLLGTATAAPRALDLGKNLEKDLQGLDVTQELEPALPQLARRADFEWPQVVTVECSAPAVIISTTTVDVTVYVTPAATGEPCPEETVTEPCPEETVTEPCPEETVTKPCPECEMTTVASATQTMTGPCDEESTTTQVVTSAPLHTGTVAPYSNHTANATSAATMLYTRNATTTRPPVSPFTTPTSTSSMTCVIDTSITPAKTATVTVTKTVDVQPTQTVWGDSWPSGKPDKGHAYCGVRASASESFFLAEFIEERPGVPVSEEGCYQFCDSGMECARDCQSYRFYHDGGSPRCALYAMPVAYVTEELAVSETSIWFDMTCGCPSETTLIDESISINNQINLEG